METQIPNVYIETSVAPQVQPGEVMEYAGVSLVISSITSYQDGVRDPILYVISGYSEKVAERGAHVVFFPVKGQ